MRYHHTSRMAIIQKTRNQCVRKDLDKKETSYTIGGNVNWYSQNGKQYGGTSKN